MTYHCLDSLGVGCSSGCESPRILHLMDTLTPPERSERMARIRGKDTAVELQVRLLVHSMGYRYRLHRKDLPGTPDMVFSSRRAVIFVHGCFWHRHEGCKLARLPKSRLEFWGPKLEANRLRDQVKQAELSRLGWRVLVIWECELKDVSALSGKLVDFLEHSLTEGRETNEGG